MLHLPRPFLAAPIFLSLACNVVVNGSASDATTSDPETTDPSGDPTTNTPSNPSNPTTNPDPSGTTGSSTESVPTTGDVGTTSTSGTTSGDPDTTGGETGPMEMACEVTIDCDKGMSCFGPFDPDTNMPGDFVCHAECVSDMGDGNSEDVWCADDDACCTPGSTCNNMGYCTPGAETSDTDTDTDTDSSGTTGVDTDTTGGSGSSSGTDTDTDGGVLPLITLSGLELFGDCMPMVPEDPITAKWNALFDNKTGVKDFTATVTSASLTYDPGGDEFLQGIEVTPKTSGVVGLGKTVMKAMTKTKALKNLPMDCDRCGDTVEVEVVFDVAGEAVSATAEAQLQCAF